MTELREVMAYLIANYPAHMTDELSNARLTKMVYLSDWKNVLDQGNQITEINWYFDNFGPFVKDIERTAREYPDIFSIVETTNMYGQQKKKFELTDTNYKPKITDGEKKSLNHIIEVTSKMYWKEFIKLVYSTHPIASSSRYSYLDLKKSAKEYRKTS